MTWLWKPYSTKKRKEKGYPVTCVSVAAMCNFSLPVLDPFFRVIVKFYFVPKADEATF